MGLSDDASRVPAEYVFRLLAERFGFTVRFSVSELAEPDEGELFVLYRKKIDHISVKKDCTVVIHRGTFFDEGYLKSVEAPGDFESLLEKFDGAGLDDCAVHKDFGLHVERDVVACVFYLLSGYGEYVATERDAHGRVLSTAYPVPEKTWDKPYGYRWLLQFSKILRYAAGEEFPTGANKGFGTQTIALTHDIDRLWKYKGSRGVKHLLRIGKAGRGNLSSEWKRVKDVWSGKARDPYNSFDGIFALKERVQGPSTVFVMGSGADKRNADYEISDRHLRGILVQSRAMGDELGLHPSWESSENTRLFGEEKGRVEQGFSTSVKGSRQHYLRWQYPKTLRDLEGAGFRYDSTGGFPDRSGFKFGWSGPFRPFDLEKGEERKIYEIPLISMDVTLAEYEKIPAELALERLTNLLDASCEDNPYGAFVFLWHNIMGDKTVFPGYADVFEYFFSVASGSSRFVTLETLLAEYEKDISESL